MPVGSPAAGWLDAPAKLIPGSRLVYLDSSNHIITEHEPASPVLVNEVNRSLSGWRA